MKQLDGELFEARAKRARSLFDLEITLRLKQARRVDEAPGTTEQRGNGAPLLPHSHI